MKKFNLLLIDDDPLFIEYLNEIYFSKRSFIKLKSSFSIKAAKNILNRFDIDLILLDLSLPDAVGLDTIAKIQNMVTDVPVVILTQNDSEKIVTQALNSGVQDFLLKSEIKVENLDRVIRYSVERNKFLSTLNQRENQLRLIHEQLPGLLWITDRNFKIQEISGQAFELSEIQKNNLKSKSIEVLLNIFRCEDNAIIEAHKKALVGQVLTIKSKVNQKWFKFALEPLLSRHNSIKGVICYGMDITQDIYQTEQLKYAQTKAEQSSNAKTMFLANMSHEIRTPLNTISGVTQILLDEYNDKFSKKYLNILGKSVKNLLSLVNDILDISKIEADKFSLYYQNFNLKELVTSSFDTLLFQAEEKGLEFNLIFDDLDMNKRYFSDPDRLRQVLLNLLSNAVKFTEKGAVSLKVSHKKYYPEKNSDIFQFIVEDTGIGIPKSKINQIFDQFFELQSLTKFKPGTGLGLFITKSIIQKLGGQINVESQLGIGTTLRVELELKRGIEKHFKNKKNILERKAMQELKKLNLLVVDDIYDNQIIINAFLKGKPYQTDYAENGRQAVEMVKSKKYDLILMDLRMPEMDGFEATKKIRNFEMEKNGKVTPIIALTANAFKEDIQKCFKSGFNDYIAKPVKKSDLIKKIELYSESLS